MIQQNWTTVIKPKNKLLDLKLSEVWKYKDLIWLFVKRDFKTMYKQTILGPLWIIITPLLTTLMQILVFGNIANLSTDGIPQFVFYMGGNAVWLYFSTCLNKTSNTFIGNAAVFGKVYFPRLVTPISIVISGLITFGVQFGIFLISVIFYASKGAVHPNLLMLLSPILIVQIAMLAMGCGIIISSLTTKYRDLAVLVTFGLQLWMYASAVVFPVSALSPLLSKLIMLNPVVPIIEAIRYSFTGSGIFSIGYLLLSLIITLIVMLVGIIIFNKVEKTFMDTI